MSNLLRLSRAFIPAAAALALAACDTTGPDVLGELRSQLRIHEDIWAENGASSYSVVIEQRCLCADEYEVMLEVVSGEIASGVHASSGDPLTAAELGRQRDLPDLFAVLEDALDRRVPGVSVSYNREIGFIERLYVDYNGGASDDDLEYIVSEYTPADAP